MAGRPRDPSAGARAYAPVNIALCKYWGKRDEVLNLPVTSSLSVSLGSLGAVTELRPCDGPDRVVLNGAAVDPDDPFARRVSAYLDLFRTSHGFEVRTESRVPVAAGLASSACGFAALVLALDRLYGWGLDHRSLSVLARLGSGSACRSVGHGFMEWQAGSRADGMDSYAERLTVDWPGLRVGLCLVSEGPKAVGSREAMRRTRETAALYDAWPQVVARDLPVIRSALQTRDFEQLGEAVEGNALAMHATMLAARPAIVYWLPGTVATLHAVRNLRAGGLPVYATMDAGPNVKLLFLEQDGAALQERFPSLRIANPNERDAS